MRPAHVLIYVGLALLAVGLLWLGAERLGLGKLPGDIVIRRKNFTVYFPLVSSIVISVLLTLLLRLFKR